MGNLLAFVGTPILVAILASAAVDVTCVGDVVPVAVSDIIADGNLGAERLDVARQLGAGRDADGLAGVDDAVIVAIGDLERTKGPAGLCSNGRLLSWHQCRNPQAHCR